MRPVKQFYVIAGDQICFFKTTNIHSILVWICTSAMMCIDAADRAKVMLRNMGAKLIFLKQMRSVFHSQTILVNKNHRRSPATAKRAIAPDRLPMRTSQINFQHYASAVTGSQVNMLFLNTRHGAPKFNCRVLHDFIFHESNKGGSAWQI